MGYTPRIYGGPESGDQWKETIDGQTYEYYTVIKDPGDGGPLGLSGNLAGDVLVYRKNTTLGIDLGQSDDILVGEIAATGPDKGKLINESPILLPHLTKELEHFSKPENLKRVKQQAIITTKKGMLATKDVNGVDIKPVADSPEDADKKARELQEDGTTVEENKEKEEEKEKEADSTPIDTADKTGSDEGISKENLYYPIDLASTDIDVLKVQMLEHAPRKVSIQGGTLGVADRPEQSKRKIGGTVFLAIPANIGDENSVRYASDEINPLQAGVVGAFLGLAEGDTQISDNIASALGKNSDSMKEAIISSLAGNVAGVNNLLARQTGQILNPNIELLFKGPQLRSFNFVFLFSPRSDSESKTVKRIIRYFKQGMAAKRNGTNFFLKSPNTFQLTYMYRGEKGSIHKGLNRFKECALETVSVNYTPNTNYATYSDGTPVAYQVTMRFKELDPIYNDDYGQLDSDDTQIPFITQGGEGGIGY